MPSPEVLHESRNGPTQPRREVLGGNGILSDFSVAKAFCDIEAFYSYEGTYDVNALVAGRGLTGISAIKPAAAGGRVQSKL